jgi:hypothetical protein
MEVKIICNDCSERHLIKGQWEHVDSYTSDERSMGAEIEHTYMISKLANEVILWQFMQQEQNILQDHQ